MSMKLPLRATLTPTMLARPQVNQRCPRRAAGALVRQTNLQRDMSIAAKMPHIYSNYLHIKELAQSNQYVISAQVL
jgi:hypothetical protein